MEQLQVDSISKILSTRGLNTLMFSDPYAKLCFVTHLASQFEKTIYVDLDTMFTAYLNAGLVHAKNSVDVYLPSEGVLAPMIKDVLASMSAGSLVIFDSVNSFYSLFRTQERGTGGLNHLLSVLLMLLVRRGADAGAPVLASSMLRYRGKGGQGWAQSPASRRLLQYKSAVRMSVELHDDGLVMRIIEHESIPAGTTLYYWHSLVTV
jgi:hypothetical protein